MSVDLHYGASNSLKIDFTTEQVATSASLNVEPIIGTLKDAVYSSLDQSIHFPAFREIVFPETL